MDYRALPSVPDDPEPTLCIFPASMLCEHCHKIASRHDADSTNDILNERNLLSDLKQLNTLIAHLNLKRSDLNRRINHHHSLIIQKLSQDVLAIVFSFCLPDSTKFYTSLSKSDLSAPLILGAVCKEWREIAWSSPELWSSMAINLASSKTILESQTSLAREWLARSGRLPLFIRIVWESYDQSFHPASVRFSAIVSNESSRWHTFHLSVPPRIYHIFCTPNFSAPILESLQFHSDIFRRSWYITFRFLFFLRHCPRLQEIRITNVSVCWIKVPKRSITRIYANSLSLMDCRTILRTNLSLVHCELMDIIIAPDGSDENPLSTNLKHLTVQAGRADEHVVSDFFKDMTAPYLEALRFEMGEEFTSVSGIRIVNTLHSFLTRSRCSLHTFSLAEVRFSLDSMMSLLNAMPTLKNFTVSVVWDYGAKETEVMLEVLARVIASQSKPTRRDFLPNLETLTFSGNPNFRPRKVPHINPLGPWTPYCVPQLLLCSVTLRFCGLSWRPRVVEECLPKEAIPFLQSVKEYGITLKVCTVGGVEDLLQPTIEFYKSDSRLDDWIQNVDLNLIGLEA